MTTQPKPGDRVVRTFYPFNGDDPIEVTGTIVIASDDVPKLINKNTLYVKLDEYPKIASAADILTGSDNGIRYMLMDAGWTVKEIS